MQVRRTAVLTAGALLAASLGATQAPAALAAPKRADLVTSKVSTPPAKVRAGADFSIGATVANKGKASAKASTLRIYLSTDKRGGRGDIVGANVKVPKVPARKSKTVSGQVRVPDQARGLYWVIACADAASKVKETKEGNNCKVSKTQVEIDADIQATITGQLTFVDEGQTADGARTKTWRRTATATVAMSFSGAVEIDPNLRSTGSSYERAGSRDEHEATDGCIYTREYRETGSGPLAYNGDKFNDDIRAHFTRYDMSELRLGLSMRANHTDTSKQTGAGPFPCEDSSRTTSGVNLDIVSIALKETAVTSHSITYAVTAWEAEYATRSDWDQVTGTLTLALR